MDIFGTHWENHTARIETAWRNTVTDEDVVLLPGDISWAMTLDEAEPDLNWIGGLPGTKVMIRGNHDYWWSGITKIRNRLQPGHYAIQNDAISLHGVAICGTRGWLLPSHPKFTQDDETIYKREAERLRLTLEAATAFQQPILVMMHYPPCSNTGEETLFTALLEKYTVHTCIYGHLHGPAHRFAFEGELNGVRYRLTSADYLHFQPLLIDIH
jgi:predicted phosphohydrolase